MSDEGHQELQHGQGALLEQEQHVGVLHEGAHRQAGRGFRRFSIARRAFQDRNIVDQFSKREFWGKLDRLGTRDSKGEVGKFLANTQVRLAMLVIWVVGPMVVGMLCVL